MEHTLTGLPLEPKKSHISKKNPIAIFSEWFGDAKGIGLKEPCSMFLATSTRCGMPSCRVVLLKSFDENGFVFYTNANSRKGADLRQNPAAAICFYWPEIRKQVRIEGRVEKVSDEEADIYFASRSLKSRIGAWASKQSEPMENKNELMKRIAYYTAKWATTNVERPPFWTGFRIIPDYFEFWRETSFNTPERKIYYMRDDLWYFSTLYP